LHGAGDLDICQNKIKTNNASSFGSSQLEAVVVNMSNSTTSRDSSKKKRAEQLDLATRELIMSLRAWGVDPTQSPRHRKFENQVLSKLVTFFGPRPAAAPSEPRILPQKIEDAVEEVLKAEVEGKEVSRCGFYIDIIGSMDYSNPPYFVRPDRIRPGKHFVTLNRQFKGIPKSQLDPLERFSSRKCTKKEVFLEQWVYGDEAMVLGHVFEAIVASFATHNMACYSCKRRRTIRWNGGPTAPWTDMECISCESAYEIKSKRNMEMVEKGYERNLNGGSYGTFHQLHQQKRKNGWKHFVVTVSRMPSYSRIPEKGPGLHKCWAVQIAEIDRLVPRLKPTSFLNDREMEFASEIVTKAPFSWFNIPYQSVEHESIVMNVLEELFPGITAEVEADDDSAEGDKPITAVKDSTTKEMAEKLNCNDVTALRNALENMATSDCWEDDEDEDD
jgi:hypothetical protein